MYKPATFVAVIALSLPTAGLAADQTAIPASPKCAALTSEAAKLQDRAGAASAKRAAGLLAGVAGRALAYAPPVNLGDGAVARATGYAVQSAAYDGAYSGLDSVRQSGAAADTKADRARLKQVRKEAADLNCPKA